MNSCNRCVNNTISPNYWNNNNNYLLNNYDFNQLRYPAIDNQLNEYQANNYQVNEYQANNYQANDPNLDYCINLDNYNQITPINQPLTRQQAKSLAKKRARKALLRARMKLQRKAKMQRINSRPKSRAVVKPQQIIHSAQNMQCSQCMQITQNPPNICSKQPTMQLNCSNPNKNKKNQGLMIMQPNANKPPISYRTIRIFG